MLLLTPASGLKIGDTDGYWRVIEIAHRNTVVEITFQNVNTGYTYIHPAASDDAYMVNRT